MNHGEKADDPEEGTKKPKSSSFSSAGFVFSEPGALNCRCNSVFTLRRKNKIIYMYNNMKYLNCKYIYMV